MGKRLSNGLADRLCKLVKVNIHENGERRYSIKSFDVTVQNPFNQEVRVAPIVDDEFWKIAETDLNLLPRVFLPNKKDT